MNVSEETDCIDGRDPTRQAWVIGLNILTLLLSIVFLIFFQYFLIWLADFPELASAYVWSRWIWVPTFALFAMFWGFVIFELEAGWDNPVGNEVRPTTNPLWPKKTSNGAYRFVIYTSGLTFLFWWEKKLPKLELEQEEIHDHLTPFTSTVDGIAIEMRLSLVSLPKKDMLSHYLQNGGTEDERKRIVGFLSDKAGSLAEVICSEPVGTPSATRTPEQVKSGQIQIAEEIVRRLEPTAAGFGFIIPDMTFIKCDWSAAVQARMDKAQEAKVVERIVDGMLTRMTGTPTSDEIRRIQELACVVAGIEGVRVHRNVVEFESQTGLADALRDSSSSLSQAVVALGPVLEPLARALIAGLERLNRQP